MSHNTPLYCQSLLFGSGYLSLFPSTAVQSYFLPVR